MISKLIAAATLAATLLSAGGPPACQPKNSSGAGAAAPAQPAGGGADVPGGIPACDTHPQPPRVILFQSKVSVRGVTTSECDLPPVEHHVQVFLEMKVGGQWVVQPDPAGQTAGNCLDIPDRGLPRDCLWIITRCEPGTWRTRVTVFGYGPPTKGYPRGIPFNFPKPGEAPVVSTSARLTCKV